MSNRILYGGTLTARDFDMTYTPMSYIMHQMIAEEEFRKWCLERIARNSVTIDGAEEVVVDSEFRNTGD